MAEVKAVFSSGFLDAADDDFMQSLKPLTEPTDEAGIDAILPKLRLTDIARPREQLPAREEFKVSLEILYKLLKNLIGKDLTKMSLPVFLNEPLSLSQKAAEMMFFSDLLDKAGEESDPVKRLAYLATFGIVGNVFICGRTDKPFNPMLGETYELVTPHYRYLAEQVSHHPPILAMNCQGAKYEISQTIVSKMSFTGKSVEVRDILPVEINLEFNGTIEHYKYNRPVMVVGNLPGLVGARWIEPQGKTKIWNADTKLECTIDFKARGFFNNDLN
jgi:oxysterol-binding protein-related protein 1/2